MSTLTGTIHKESASTPMASVILQFTPLAYPLPSAGQVMTGGIYEVTTDENGEFTIELTPAVWRVEWWGRGVKNRGMFALTSAGGDLADLLVSTVGETAPYYFDTVEEFQESTTNAQVVGIGADANGDPAVFRVGGSGTHDGVNIIVRNDGVVYTRMDGLQIVE